MYKCKYDRFVNCPVSFPKRYFSNYVVLCWLHLFVFIYPQELKLPFTFMSGHIHELRIHVPWTKLGSEPVVITINTMECILKLRDGAQVSYTLFFFSSYETCHPLSISNKFPFVILCSLYGNDRTTCLNLRVINTGLLSQEKYLKMNFLHFIV